MAMIHGTRGHTGVMGTITIIITRVGISPTIPGGDGMSAWVGDGTALITAPTGMDTGTVTMMAIMTGDTVIIQRIILLLRPTPPMAHEALPA